MSQFIPKPPAGSYSCITQLGRAGKLLWESPESPGMLWLTPHPAPCSGAAPGLLWGQDTLSPAP